MLAVAIINTKKKENEQKYPRGTESLKKHLLLKNDVYFKMFKKSQNIT